MDFEFIWPSVRSFKYLRGPTLMTFLGQAHTLKKTGQAQFPNWPLKVISNSSILQTLIRPQPSISLLLSSQVWICFLRAIAANICLFLPSCFCVFFSVSLFLAASRSVILVQGLQQWLLKVRPHSDFVFIWVRDVRLLEFVLPLFSIRARFLKGVPSIRKLVSEIYFCKN